MNYAPANHSPAELKIYVNIVCHVSTENVFWSQNRFRKTMNVC